MGLAGTAIRLARMVLLSGLLCGVASCKEAPTAPTAPPRAWSAPPHRSSAEFEGEIRAFEAEHAKSPMRPGEVLFVGSSSIRKWQSLDEDFSPHLVRNRGFGGATIRNIIDFGRRVVLPYSPSRIVFFAGSNDIQAGATPSEVLTDFKTFVAGVHEVLPETRIAFISITTSPSRFDKIATVRATNGLIRDYIATNPKLTFIDVFAAMLDAAGRPRPELYLDDRLHLNRQGYALWIPLIEPFLRS